MIIANGRYLLHAHSNNISIFKQDQGHPFIGRNKNKETSMLAKCCCKADFRLMPRQWEMSLQSNAVSHWLGAILDSALLLWSWCKDDL